ncbi:MAG: class I tRNA ligase family protein [Candidatus Saccharibacteria bacterium]
MQRYNPKDIEPKWQAVWDETGVYTADLQSSKPKYIAMSMFNYPSGAGIHIGHAMNYTISDVKARFKRQQGYESYHPVGWDAFGLPAENYAIKAGVSPQESMATIIPSYHKQYKAMGWSNDWEKEIATHLPEYYKWTQWIFTQMFKHGLAYQDSRMQWWCAIDNTVLANEQVIDGKCWRHDGPDDRWSRKRKSSSGSSRLPNMPTSCWRRPTSWIGPKPSRQPRRTGSARASVQRLTSSWRNHPSG